MTCETAAIYVQGEESKIIIDSNEIKNCNATGIKIIDFVDAEIKENQLQGNNDGIELENNNSHVFNNEIDKSHGHGVMISCTLENTKCHPKIKGNIISN